MDNFDNIKDLLKAIAEDDDCEVRVHKFEETDYVQLMVSMAHELGKLEAVKRVVAREKYSADVVRTILGVELGAEE